MKHRTVTLSSSPYLPVERTPLRLVVKQQLPTRLLLKLCLLAKAISDGIVH
jgi:hypothetical protein